MRLMSIFILLIYWSFILLAPVLAKQSQNPKNTEIVKLK